MKLLFSKIWNWLFLLYCRIRGIKKKEIVTLELTPEEKETIRSIEVMAFVIGMPKKQVEADLKKALTGEALKQALDEVENVFQGKDKIGRRSIRYNRKKRNISFSNVIKKRLR
jgi:uncharacterized protein YktB (UPF0637 family)